MAKIKKFYYLKPWYLILLFKFKIYILKIEAWRADGMKSKMCTARPGWMNISFRRGLYKDTMRNIEVNLIDIIKVDTESRVVTVEPLVSMGQMTAMLNPLGWTLPVLPELDDLTVGMSQLTPCIQRQYRFSVALSWLSNNSLSSY